MGVSCPEWSLTIQKDEYRVKGTRGRMVRPFQGYLKERCKDKARRFRFEIQVGFGEKLSFYFPSKEINSISKISAEFGGIDVPYPLSP